jgi:osmoprotectant transport system ATP-binding protein
VDPIVRTRLQEEFLRLQAEVRKTIVLVTHDLDEAVRLGDRIAVLSEGGRLEQYDTPAALLGSPATPFVREFVGADRGIRRLAVTPVTREMLAPLPAQGVGEDPPTVTLGSPAYDALALMLAAGTDRVVVGSEQGPTGVLTRDRLLAAD